MSFLTQTLFFVLQSLCRLWIPLAHVKADQIYQLFTVESLWSLSSWLAEDEMFIGKHLFSYFQHSRQNRLKYRAEQVEMWHWSQDDGNRAGGMLQAERKGKIPDYEHPMRMKAKTENTPMSHRWDRVTYMTICKQISVGMKQFRWWRFR